MVCRTRREREWRWGMGLFKRGQAARHQPEWHLLCVHASLRIVQPKVNIYEPEQRLYSCKNLLHKLQMWAISLHIFAFSWAAHQTGTWSSPKSIRVWQQILVLSIWMSLSLEWDKKALALIHLQQSFYCYLLQILPNIKTLKNIVSGFITVFPHICTGDSHQQTWDTSWLKTTAPESYTVAVRHIRIILHPLSQQNLTVLNFTTKYVKYYTLQIWKKQPIVGKTNPRSIDDVGECKNNHVQPCTVIMSDLCSAFTQNTHINVFTHAQN